MGLNQIPPHEESPAYPSSWLHVKPQISFVRPSPLCTLNTHPCLGYSLITLFLSHTPFIWYLAKHLHAPSQRSMVAYLHPLPFCGPPWLCVQHKKWESMQASTQLSGSMKSSLWFLLDVFLNHLCKVLNDGGIRYVLKMLCLDSSEFWIHLALFAMVLWSLFLQSTRKLLSLFHFSAISTM